MRGVCGPGDNFALCLLDLWPALPLPSLQLDFNLCIMRTEWETKQKQAKALAANTRARTSARPLSDKPICVHMVVFFFLFSMNNIFIELEFNVRSPAPAPVSVRATAAAHTSSFGPGAFSARSGKVCWHS